MSDMLARLMDRFPIILWIGAAILGRVGGEMMISDPWVIELLHPSKPFTYAVEIFFVVFVCGLAKILLRRREATAQTVAETADAA
jgi:predicted tellurium resistance membrane protein TerC